MISNLPQTILYLFPKLNDYLGRQKNRSNEGVIGAVEDLFAEQDKEFVFKGLSYFINV